MEEERGRSWIRMEEEEDEGIPVHRQSIGFGAYVELEEERKEQKVGPPPGVYQNLLKSLAEERRKIINLSVRQKRELLDENRKHLS